MKIIVLDGHTLNPGDLSWDALHKFGEVTIYDRTPEDKIIERIADAQIIFTNKTPIKKSVFEQCKSLKYIGVLATGYNVVDIEAAKEYGIIVTNIPTYGTNAVAQFTIALLLEVCHNIGNHNQSVKNGDWSNSRDFCYWNYPLIELYGKTIGIIGYGKIGQKVSLIAKALGMNVIAYNAVRDNFPEYRKLDELFKNSDVISLHCPLFPSTQNMINDVSISKMKDGVILINTSRGQLIGEQALANALNNDKVAYAAVDVVSTEPISSENPLLKAKNCIITPHIAWAPKETRQRLMDIAINNLNAFINNNAENVVG